MNEKKKHDNDNETNNGEDTNATKKKTTKKMRIKCNYTLQLHSSTIRIIRRRITLRMGRRVGRIIQRKRKQIIT